MVIAAILGASVAAVYFSSINTQKTPSPSTNPSLAVGDTFTYKLAGFHGPGQH